MKLYKIKVMSAIYTSQGNLPVGATAEAVSQIGCALTVPEVADALERKYGVRPSNERIISCCKWEVID